MAQNILEIAEVNISAAAQVASAPSFGTLLIVGPSTTGVLTPGQVREYTSFEAVSADWDSDDEEYKAANAFFSQSPRPTKCLIAARNAANPIADEMDAIRDANPDFYAVVLTEDGRNGVADLAMAAWVEAQTAKKIFLVSSDTSQYKLGTGVNVAFSTLGYRRTFSMSRAIADEYPESALFGIMASVDYTGVDTVKTAHGKRLAGITAEDLTDTEFAAIRGANGNTYGPVGPLPIVFDSRSAAGPPAFLDSVIFQDWLEAEIQTEIYNLTTSVNKIPFTDRGIGQVEAVLRQALSRGVRNGGLAGVIEDDGTLSDAFSISTPRIGQISRANKANRILSGITFSARGSDAIHKTIINGSVTI